MAVERILGPSRTLPPSLVTMKSDDLMRDYLQSRVAHYVHLLSHPVDQVDGGGRAIKDREQPQQDWYYDQLIKKE
jgi:hypothetical protein